MKKPISREIPVPGGSLPIAVCEPPESHPALVIIPSIFGITDGLQAQMQELASDAFVITMDPFWRTSPGTLTMAEGKVAFKRSKETKPEQTLSDFKELISWARRQEQCNGKVAGLGICFGGPFCLVAAAEKELDGVVTWHGTRMERFLQNVEAMTCPMGHHMGGADKFVPERAVEKIKAAFAEHKDVDFTIHPDCDHGFTERGNQYAYNPKAESAAMAGAREIIKKIQ